MDSGIEMYFQIAVTGVASIQATFYTIRQQLFILACLFPNDLNLGVTPAYTSNSLLVKNDCSAY